MEFAALPPEINSGRMYSGPGSGPMRAVAAGWDGLATELQSAAASYASVIASLTDGTWLGPASASMAAAAAPYLAWLSATAVRTEQTAAQAKAAAGAYETAFAMTVPPPVIAANRSLLMTLVATNLLGQNTPAIAAAETQYGEMWAQDAAAMYSYAGAAAAASTLTPFTPPQNTANPGGPAGQTAAVAQATGTSTATKTQTVLSQLSTEVPAALQGLAMPLQSTQGTASSTSALTGILQSLGLTSPLSLLSPADAGLSSGGLSTASGAWGSASHADAMIINAQGQLAGVEGRIMNRFDQLAALKYSGSAARGTGALPAAVSAGLGRSALVGGLSVPQGWATAAPAIRPVAVAFPSTSLSTAAAGSANSPGSLFGEMALASMAGRAVSGTVSAGRRESARATTRVGVAPPQSPPGSPVTGIAAELRELADLRDSGILTNGEFSEQKRRLLGR